MATSAVPRFASATFVARRIRSNSANRLGLRTIYPSARPIRGRPSPSTSVNNAGSSVSAAVSEIARTPKNGIAKPSA